MISLLLTTVLCAKPNFLFFFIDDLRYDALGNNRSVGITPAIDSIAKNGVKFTNAFAVLPICSPSRATVLTGRNPSSHRITTYGNRAFNTQVNPSFVHALADAGYHTAVIGKWHLGNKAKDMGFQTIDIFHGNGRWYNRIVHEGSTRRREPEFIETWSANRTIKVLQEAAAKEQPFFIWHNTQVPHLTSSSTWPATKESLDLYEGFEFPLPASYPPDHKKTGKPSYLKNSRSFKRAMETYNYKTEAGLRKHMLDYHASVTDMDKQLGRVLNKLQELGLEENTYTIFLSDNGWQIGEHGLTSKVLGYDKSMRVPLYISGPGITPGSVNANFVTNVDMAPMLLDLAGANVSGYTFHGASLKEQLEAQPSNEVRSAVYYESPTPQLIERPFNVYRDSRYLYVQTLDVETREVIFEELYNLTNDPDELRNLALETHRSPVRRLLRRYRRNVEQAKVTYHS